MTYRTRRFRRSAVVVAATAAVFVGAAPAQANHHWYKHVRTDCIATPNDSTGGYLISAGPVYKWGTNAHKNNNLRKFIIKTRMVPVAAGHNWFRNWHKQTLRVKAKDADKSHNFFAGVHTEPQSDSFDWNVEVDLRWDRKHKKDWHVRTTIPFDEGFCETG